MTKVALLLLLLCPPCLTAQGKTGHAGEARYVTLPRERILMVVANQPDCPLKIEDASFLLRLDQPGSAQRYRVRNVSNKPIRLFTLVSWSIGGAGGTLPITFDGSRGPLNPGETFESTSGGGFEVVPFTAEVRAKLERERGFNPGAGMKNLFILLVDQVYFADGTVYRDQDTSQAVQKYLDRFDVVQ